MKLAHTFGIPLYCSAHDGDPNLETYGAPDLSDWITGLLTPEEAIKDYLKKKIANVSKEQVEQYAIAILENRGLFETIMLLAGITHDQAEASGDKALMADSDLIFQLAQKLNCADL